MKRFCTPCITLILLLCFISVNHAGSKCTADPSGWKYLFDGKTLKGWKATGDPKGWTVENGTIVNLAKGGGYLASEKTYGNFQLELEFKLEKGVNSGVFFRWANLSDPVQTGIEIQLLDSYGVQNPSKHDCGAIYDCLEPKKNACKPAGEWNNLLLTCKNNMILVDLNGERIIVMNLDKWTTPHKNPDGTKNKFNTAYKDMPRSGHIGFQDHGGKIWFRNIRIREL
ncbi:MAG: DUF1080 domain-containing protein [Armatimonadetes bacterium]|nr:DUF1080 domain-containing protein [Armatimonadota bacterium]